MTHCRKIISPPDLLALHQYKPDVYPYLLASNTSGAVNTRYSILMAYPEQTIVQNIADDDCLLNIQTPLTSNQADKEYPFIGGWFIFLSYEYASVIESSVNFHTDKLSLPLAFISRIPAAIIIDHQLQVGIIVSNHDREDLIQQIMFDIASAPTFNNKTTPVARIEEEDPAIYLGHLEKTHEYIKNGDIFQANLFPSHYNQGHSPL